MNDDSFLKQLLTLHLFDTFLLPIITKYLLGIGLLFMIGVHVGTSMYNDYCDNQIIEQFNEFNFPRIILIEETQFDQNEANKLPVHRNVMVFDGSDALDQATQWLKDNSYWFEAQDTWEASVERGRCSHGPWEIYMQSESETCRQYINAHVHNGKFSDKNYPPNHVINTRKITSRIVNHTILFEQDLMFGENQKHVVMNGSFIRGLTREEQIALYGIDVNLAFQLLATTSPENLKKFFTDNDMNMGSMALHMEQDIHLLGN